MDELHDGVILAFDLVEPRAGALIQTRFTEDAVTKYATLDVNRGLIDVGVSILGENRVQELTKRAAMINEWTPGAGANRIEKLVLGRAGFGHVGQHRRPVIDRPGFVEYHGFGIKT